MTFVGQCHPVIAAVNDALQVLQLANVEVDCYEMALVWNLLVYRQKRALGSVGHGLREVS